MADSFASTMITSNGFGDLFIGETSNTMDIGSYYSRYLRGQSQPTSVINLGGVFSRLPAYDGGSMSTLTVGGTWEEVNTQAFLSAEEDFNAHVFWLWGSLKTGGFFFFKNQAGSVMYAGVCYGWYKYKTTGIEEAYKFAYMMGRGYDPNGFTASSSLQVAITFTGQRSYVGSEGISVKYPSFEIFSGGIDSPVSIRDVVLTPIEPAPLPPALPNMASYPNVRTGSLVEAMATTGYVEGIWSDPDFNNQVPERIWKATRQQPIDVILQNVNIFEWQGSWSGGKEIDTGIDPYSTGQPANASGDKGSYPTKSDTTLPTNPNASGIDAIGTGFVTLYNPSVAEVKAFNDYLFDGSITEAMANGLKKLIADPIDYLVFIAMVHFAPTVDLTSQEITFCGLSSGVFSKIIPSGNQFQVLDFGDIVIDEPTCSFMDYSPLSKASIFIPYVGFRDLPIDDIMGGGSVNLKYHVDLLTGAFIAQVSVKRPTRSQFPGDATPGYNTIIAQYEGNCFEMLPLSSTDFRNMFSGMLGVVGGLASVAGGNIGGLGAMASSVMGMKTNVNRSGQATGSYGYAGKQQAFILLSRPFQCIPLGFGGYEGYPSNMNMTVAECSGTAEHDYNDGYLETDANTVWGTDITYEYNSIKISATDGEISEIQDLFNKGVIINV